MQKRGPGIKGKEKQTRLSGSRIARRESSSQSAAYKNPELSSISTVAVTTEYKNIRIIKDFN